MYLRTGRIRIRAFLRKRTDMDTGVFVETYGYGYRRFVRTYAIETGEDCIQSSCLIYECYYIGLLLKANT